jgi:hypothetical protein
LAFKLYLCLERDGVTFVDGKRDTLSPDHFVGTQTSDTLVTFMLPLMLLYMLVPLLVAAVCAAAVTDLSPAVARAVRIHPLTHTGQESWAHAESPAPHVGSSRRCALPPCSNSESGRFYWVSQHG